jgi:ornithine cyclodeaminase/alanine dehydrogenase-like protein (mu-crystallin family)
MTVLLLTEEEVRRLLTMEMALEGVEEGLRKLALDEAQNNPRTRVQTDQVMLHVLSAAAKTLGVAGYKIYATSRKCALSTAFRFTVPAKNAGGNSPPR